MDKESVTWRKRFKGISNQPQFMISLETKRCFISALHPSDAPFIFNLLNSPGWLQFIGDRGIRTLEDAYTYIRDGPAKSYQENGFGLCIVKEKLRGEKLGLCGLLKREQMEDVEIGFAFLPEFNGLGYALEAVTATLSFAHDKLKLFRLIAITNNDNFRSIQLLEKSGFIFEKMIPWPNEDDLKLYAINLINYAP